MKIGTKESTNLESRLLKFIDNARARGSVDDMKYARGQIRSQFGFGKLSEGFFQKMEESTNTYIDSNGKKDPFGNSSLGSILGAASLLFVLWCVLLPHSKQNHQNVSGTIKEKIEISPNERPVTRFIQPMMSSEERAYRRSERKRKVLKRMKARRTKQTRNKQVKQYKRM